MDKRLSPKELYESNMRILSRMEKEYITYLAVKGLVIILFMAAAFILGALIF